MYIYKYTRDLYKHQLGRYVCIQIDRMISDGANQTGEERDQGPKLECMGESTGRRQIGRVWTVIMVCS